MKYWQAVLGLLSLLCDNLIQTFIYAEKDIWQQMYGTDSITAFKVHFLFDVFILKPQPKTYRNTAHLFSV